MDQSQCTNDINRGLNTLPLKLDIPSKIDPKKSKFIETRDEEMEMMN